MCKRKCSEVQRCTPCKQPRCAFAAPDGGLENGGVGGGGGEASSNSETGHCHLPLCPLPSASSSSSSSSSSSLSSTPADGCCGLGLQADLPHSSDSSPCCLHQYDDCQARGSDAADHLSINHLPSSILLKVRVHQNAFQLLLLINSVRFILKGLTCLTGALTLDGEGTLPVCLSSV